MPDQPTMSNHFEVNAYITEILLEDSAFTCYKEHSCPFVNNICRFVALQLSGAKEQALPSPFQYQIC